VALISLPEMTVNAAGTPPKRTAVVAVRSVPVRVTVLPPVVGPAVGAREARVGAGR
jgi:hypothetical protein